MNIFFNKNCYNLNSLDKLVEAAPFFEEGIKFIQQFSCGQPTFEFKTSGATGMAKMITITRRQILASIKQTENALGLKKGETVLVCLSPGFVATKMMLARCMKIGMDIVLKKPSSNPFESLDVDDQIDFASFVPLQVQHIIDSEHTNILDGIRNILIGGGPISLGLEYSLSTSKSNIYHTYGMTESVSHIALRKLNSGNKLFEILGDTLAHRNDDGCLSVKGEITNNQTVETNDLVEFEDKRHFKWLGRKDNLINSGGVKIISEAVEEFLAPLMTDIQITSDFFLYGIKDNLLGEKLIMIVEGEIQSKSIFKHIANPLKTKFGKYHIPKEIYWVREFTRTSSGKIKRKATLELIKGEL
ncbi:MAG: AMP-binding protein [Cyclobacteriaceae bacterium]